MTTFKAKITGLERLDNSVNGNPRYKVVYNGKGLSEHANTLKDAAFAYAMTDSYIGKRAQFTLNSRRGITDIELV